MERRNSNSSGYPSNDRLEEVTDCITVIHGRKNDDEKKFLPKDDNRVSHHENKSV